MTRAVTYGSPRVVLDLCEAGWQVSVNTVAGVDGPPRPGPAVAAASGGR